MSHSIETIRDRISDSIDVKRRLSENEDILNSVLLAAGIMTTALLQGGRILFCGNGGSAADAQHYAAELSGKFLFDRQPLDAEALHVNTSFLTAVANDYSYAEVYARLVRAKGRNGDVIVGISTSGNSLNIVRAFEEAHGIGMKTVGLTGEDGGILATLCDVLIPVPSQSTPRIQECHLIIGHVLCEIVEAECFRKDT